MIFPLTESVLTLGVPQGSIFGPLYFNASILDLSLVNTLKHTGASTENSKQADSQAAAQCPKLTF